MLGRAWRLLLVVIVLVGALPAQAGAAIDLYFQTSQYLTGTGSGQIFATNLEWMAGPGLCSPSGGADCRGGPPTSLRVERDGQVFTSMGSSFWYEQARPIVPVAPRAGDVVRVLVEGVEKAVVTFDGRPTLDGNCVPPGGERVFRGSFDPAATLEVTRQEYPGSPERAAVTIVGDRYEATFAQPSGSFLVIASHGTAPKADGGTIGVHSTLTPGRPPCPVAQIKTSIKPPARRTAVRVRRDGRFRLGHRPVCPAALTSCQVEVKVEPYGAVPRLLGLRRYKVEGGSSLRARGRLRRSALARLRRVGRLKVFAEIAIGAPPTKVPPFVQGKPSGKVAVVTLLAPR